LEHVTHPVFILHHFARADAKHDVVRLVIAPAEKMNIICRDQSDAKIPRNLRQRCHAFALFFHSVIVQFDEKILSAENVPIFGRALFRLLDVVCLNCGVDFARETATQPDQSFRVRGEQLFVDPRRIMEPFKVRCRHQLDEISVASLVFRQESEMIGCVAPRSGAVFI
jgi:hypothetical protein